MCLFGREDFGISILIRWAVRHELLRLILAKNPIVFLWGGFLTLNDTEDVFLQRERFCRKSFWPCIDASDRDRWADLTDATFLAHILKRTIIVVSKRRLYDDYGKRNQTRKVYKTYVFPPIYDSEMDTVYNLLFLFYVLYSD